ncbi:MULTISPECIES: dTMP kinase [Kribbella]|uniref:Thymidylate kinase n=1 Tax=Kribbella pratensis TaxID=2512112 RepID=A0ABY2FFW9_9ACTN|nr:MULTISPECIES: dTMP kinase [Kribbella]TDW90274.1 thymidylate kinase [Kribbella pratensis]TDW97996.1 thymidylate kinase [Kribbella sp. VKM Ac-2566]
MPEVYDPLTDPAPAHDVRAVLRIRAFRRLWIGFGLSSLGDWIGLLALTAMAKSFAGDDYQAANFAIGGVLFLRVLPALVMGPVAGWIADRLDRRWTMIVGDLIRAAFFVSIPIVGTLTWVLVATVLIEIVSLVWGPAKDASVPNLVPRHRLEAANQLSLITTYGTALPAAVIFTAITLVSRWAGDFAIDLAVYVNAATFVISAFAIVSVAEIGRAIHEHEDHPTLWRTVVEGWSYVTGTPVVRGLVIGISGAFAAGAVVIGLGRTYVEGLGAGDPGYGVLFGAVFGGLALGMGFAPRIFSGLSRRRLFAAGLVGSGICLAGLALIQQIEIATMIAVLLGFCAGGSWVSGYTLLGLEVPDAVRGRTFAFVQSAVRTVLAITLAIAPFAAGAIGRHTWTIGGRSATYNGASMTMVAAAVLAGVIGLLAWRQMDDRPGVPFWRDVRRSFGKTRGDYPTTGLFIALEGGEGAGKSTQSALLVKWLEEQGQQVLLTREPGATELGKTLRQIVLDPATGDISHRAEALLYAADKAEHVDSVIKPALKSGAVVITDRYVDSALAYQGSGRDLDLSDVERVNRWATNDLRPNLTILLDLPPKKGLGRFAERDRIEAQSDAFHERVRNAFLELAAAEPQHYLVLDATQDREDIAQQIRARLQPMLPKVSL